MTLPHSLQQLVHLHDCASVLMAPDERRVEQAQRKQRWRDNQTAEQKVKRKFLDAARKRREREKQSVEQRKEMRMKDKIRKAKHRVRVRDGKECGKGNGEDMVTDEGVVGEESIEEVEESEGRVGKKRKAVFSIESILNYP